VNLIAFADRDRSSPAVAFSIEGENKGFVEGERKKALLMWHE
jgi:hypothetical protein